MYSKKYRADDYLTVVVVVVLVVFAWTSIQAKALRIPYRSVARCDERSTIVAEFTSQKDCETHCQHTYIKTSLDSMDWNKGLAQSLVENTPLEAGRQVVRRCCCLFNAPWPKDFVRPEMAGLHPKQWRKTAGRGECLPLMVSVNIEKRTRKSYETLCHYLEMRRPLTMLETMRFAEAAGYLNFMQPKHPAIWMTLRLKQVSKLDKHAVDQLRAAFYNNLLDHNYVPLDQYGGYRLSASQLREFSNTRNSIEWALRSRLVAEAFDELVVSYILIDMLAAHTYISGLNQNQFLIPEKLIQGHYDKYDTTNKHHDFTLTGEAKRRLDCNLLKQTKNQLENYLAAVRSLSDLLYEKLMYEHIAEHYSRANELIHMGTIYRNIIEVNCQ